MFAVKSDDERKNEAAAVFAKWIAESQNNLDFVTKAGYLPVTNSAFDTLLDGTVEVENEKYQMLFSAVADQYKDNYSFCSVPLFDGASSAQKDFEVLIKSTLSSAHTQYTERVQNGEDKDAVMNELMQSALAAVKAALK